MFFCFLFDVSGGLSPVKMQQMLKELTNGVTEAKSLSEGNRDPCVNHMKSTKAIEKQAGVQQASSQRTERYDPSVGAVKLIMRAETTLAFSCKHQRRVIRRHCLSLKMLVGSCLLLQRDFTCNSPWDNIFCFICLLCAPAPEVVQQRKSLHDYMSQIKSK